MTGVGLIGVELFTVPLSLAQLANAHLREVGTRGYEGFALWAGRRSHNGVDVVETIIPKQSGIRSDEGVCVTVDGEELFRINVYLYERNLMLVAQLHSHPTDAYHSETDDSYPIATTAGALSLVIPDFARHPFCLRDCAVYRLFPGTGWQEVPPHGASKLIRIVED